MAQEVEARVQSPHGCPLTFTPLTWHTHAQIQNKCTNKAIVLKRLEGEDAESLRTA